MAWWVPLIGAGIGMLQGMQKKKQEREQMALDAQAMKYSPYIDIRGAQAPRQTLMAPMMQGALAGAQFSRLNKDLWATDPKKPPKVTADDAVNRVMTENLRRQQQQQGMQGLINMYSDERMA